MSDIIGYPFILYFLTRKNQISTTTKVDKIYQKIRCIKSNCEAFLIETRKTSLRILNNKNTPKEKPISLRYFLTVRFGVERIKRSNK